MLDFFPIGRLDELQHFVNVLRSDVPNGGIRVIFRTKVIVKIGSSDNVMRPEIKKVELKDKLLIGIRSLG